jgi:hypothetical protein
MSIRPLRAKWREVEMGRGQKLRWPQVEDLDNQFTEIANDPIISHRQRIYPSLQAAQIYLLSK